MADVCPGCLTKRKVRVKRKSMIRMSDSGTLGVLEQSRHLLWEAVY